MAALPKYATRPMESTMTLSKPAKTDAGGWWIVHATAMFCSRATFLRKVIMRTADAESTPLVGSSRNKIFGRLTSASATESRRLLPEDRPRMISLPARVCWNSSRPTECRSLSTSAARWVTSRSPRCSAIAYSKCSRAVRDAHRVSNCST